MVLVPLNYPNRERKHNPLREECPYVVYREKVYLYALYNGKQYNDQDKEQVEKVIEEDNEKSVKCNGEDEEHSNDSSVKSREAAYPEPTL